jgi:hypothetical protein
MPGLSAVSQPNTAMRFNNIGFLFLLFFTVMDCAAQTKVATKPPVEGIRIAWDYTTLTRVSAGGGGYARLIQMHDKSLLCVYEAAGSTVCVKSNDGGKSWSTQTVIAPREAGVSMSVPDILQLKDHSLLACYNPRPSRGADTSKHFGIKTRKSYDSGQTWTDERTLYQADNKFDNGCWEPSAIQLPNGEIQLFFANESPYRNSNEQEIAMVRSTDGGLTWSTAAATSFRPGSRDGMPVPVLLKNGKEIVYAIEDNGFKNFKPYVIRSSVSNNWQKSVGAADVNRTYALADKIPDSIYAGAPYLRQLKTGETILSYQGTEGRINDMNHSEMKVVIGDDRAMNFNRKTVPFKLTSGKSGLWNSLSVLDDSTVVALTNTNNYSADRGSEVWMIKGHVIPELTAKRVVRDNSDQMPLSQQIFIGHDGPANLKADLNYIDEMLYVMLDVKVPNGNYDMTISLDPQNKSYTAPDKGVFKIVVNKSNDVTAFEGNFGEWKAIKLKGLLNDVKNKYGDSYLQVVGIPWAAIGGKPALNRRIGFNIALTTDGYTENISSNAADKPYTWCTLKLK